MHFHEYFTAEELTILRTRAERLATISTETGRLEQPALRVRIGQEHYVLPMATLASVYEGVPVTPVPCTPEHIMGVANLRGHIIPVLRLSYLLGITVEETEVHIIVASHKDSIVGIAVSGVNDIVNYAHEDVTPLTLETHRWIKGMLKDGTPILEISLLLNDPTLTVQDLP